jgi:hypothetical protein
VKVYRTYATEENKLLFWMLYLLGCRIGGAVVGVLATEPEGRRLEPSQGDGFLGAIKIRSTPSFRWEVKPEVFTAC